MAVRDDFSAGEVLAAADLNDTFASKPTFTYGTATPTADAEGAIWYDENDTPPTPKFWDGSAWQPFSSGVDDAVISSPAATGSYTDSGTTYNYYTFTSSGTLTVSTSGLVDVVVVGGGGGGAMDQGGGGGGGGHYAGQIVLPDGSYTVTIGAGGSGGVYLSSNPTNGNATALGFLSVLGGGCGGNGETNSNNLGKDGACGGGGGNQDGGSGTKAGGTGMPHFDGGTGGTDGATWRGGGGGGGSSSIGTNASSSATGSGGNGTSDSLTGTSVGRCGGGSGGGSNAGSASTSDGGAAGVSSGSATAAPANRGGGGGGAGNNANGSNGGSGIVIVRVAA